VTQVQMAYNSNKIEGSRLSEEQTEQLFQTSQLISTKPEELIRADDIIEAMNHFRAFDFILDSYDEEITFDYIKELHTLMKRGTSDESNPTTPVGDFKKFPNVVGNGVEEVVTSKPSEVEKDLGVLLQQYQAIIDKKSVTINGITDFHVKFETVHPFADGNGRVGRLLIFKECLKNNIMPFVLNEEYRLFYTKGLTEYRKGDKHRLLDTFGASQDNYQAFLSKMEFTGSINEQFWKTN